MSFAFSMTENNPLMMKRTSTLILILFSVFCSGSLGSFEYHLINLSRTYQEAKEYCRGMFTDLATVTSSEDMNNLINLVSNTTGRAWIGLETGNVGFWHWSLSDQLTDFFNWRLGEPQENTLVACAAMDQSGKWFESDCNAKRNFVCQDDGENSSHIFVAKARTWRKAQSYCRELSSDLVSIHSAEENIAVQNAFTAENVWIGLFKDPWIWSDGSVSSFRFWRPNQPNYQNDQNCTVAAFVNGGQWNDRNCNGKQKFICHGAMKPTPTTSISKSTETLLTTSAQTSPTDLSKTSPEMTTFDETWFTTELPTTTDFTTTAAATTGATHLATLKESSSQATTNKASTINSWPSENLILIHKNLTWPEALSYCRKHHFDLVHIRTREIQDTVAEKIKNATSAYVWLGLRYTCKFHFWFWISSSSGCYQNWLPGHGPEGEYDCGASGAIDATGGQQWVGLPETEKLNFMCSMCAG